MAYLVRLTDRAVRDLEELYSRIEADSSAVAHAWFEGLVRATAGLARLPHRGKQVSKRPMIRRILYGRRPDVYRITYLVDDRRRAAEILHIRHSARSPHDETETG